MVVYWWMSWRLCAVLLEVILWKIIIFAKALGGRVKIGKTAKEAAVPKAKEAAVPVLGDIIDISPARHQGCREGLPFSWQCERLWRWPKVLGGFQIVLFDCNSGSPCHGTWFPLSLLSCAFSLILLFSSLLGFRESQTKKIPRFIYIYTPKRSQLCVVLISHRRRLQKKSKKLLIWTP